MLSYVRLNIFDKGEITQKRNKIVTKFHSEQKITVTMEFDKSILTVSFFFDDVEVDCVFGPPHSLF